MIRAVVDTNLIVSSLFWGGIPRKVYQTAALKQFTLLATEALLAELYSVLVRDKFKDNLAALGLTPDQFMMQYRILTLMVEPIAIAAGSVRDPKDNIILACAVGGNADFIVSGDKDLLVLNPYQNIQIISAAEFLQHLTSS